MDKLISKYLIEAVVKGDKDTFKKLLNKPSTAKYIINGKELSIVYLENGKTLVFLFDKTLKDAIYNFTNACDELKLKFEDGKESPNNKDKSSYVVKLK